MNMRFWVVMVLVGSSLAGCGSARPPAAVTTGNGDVQQPEQGGSVNIEPAPERVESAATLNPEAGQAAAPVDAGIHCTETDPHPMGQSIAQTYHVAYEEVMTFFCSGVGFDDIMLAYQTADLAGRDVKEVLTLWYDFGNWDDVWVELGLE